ncbi:redox-sensing transcriptional repressor Rex [Mesoterricola sediminis]|uniref:Redox-sensing transcriptional repressor Rex n=1 Tax=Mesoterricola sediminis TaxID=2927980 RepID=A0AA48GZ36_9BACT|nr:redox-sensing transcriptional repressor Rex [Mesoterricola sediminis]BDU77055.1 redox-sensing transcriptional repressor Rex [Mesoterricola sediminis]
MPASAVPTPTLRRLPKYYHYLQRIHMEGQEIVSATQMAEDLGIHHTQVRKDLAATGSQGKPKVGHRVADLLASIETFLNWNTSSDACLVGAGNLGSALLGYSGFDRAGIRITAAFDAHPAKVGKKIHGVPVFPVEKLDEAIRRLHITIGILTIPADRAQHIAEVMVGAGIRAIWNFAPITLTLPEDIIVENVELYASLAIFSRKLSERAKQKA